MRAKLTDDPAVEEPPLNGAAADLSLARIVPESLWFHLLLAVTGFAMSAALVAAGVWLVQVESYAGPVAGALFAPGTGSAVRWVASTQLVLVSQLGLVVWWIRSHSLKDFGGRYHLWRRVAVAAVLWSFALSTGCHAWAGRALAARLAWTFEDAGTVAWMGPALLAGVWLVWGLHREMSACRPSLSCVQAASLAGFAYVLIDLRLVPLPTDWIPQTASVLDGIVLASVWLLATGSLLHARFVVHQNAEPSSTPRWRLRIPRPHFRFAGWRSRSAAELNDAESSEPAEPKVKPVSPKTRAAKADPPEPETEQSSPTRSTKLPAAKTSGSERVLTRPATNAAAESPVESRLTAPQAQVEPSPVTPPPASRAVSAGQPGLDSEAPPQPRKPAIVSREAEANERLASARAVPESTTPQPARGFNASSALFATRLADDDVDDETGDDREDPADDERFQGLSKKQRRKMLAKERSQRTR